ncbi:MAG: isochorismatase family protein [Inhella sp.]
MNAPALIVIDVQNDYFPGGAFALAQTEAALQATLQAIAAAQRARIPVVLVQHVADASRGIAPFFNAGSEGVEIHPQIRAAAPEAPVVVKHFADSFERTTLHDTLSRLGCRELVLCGMMSQNCVTHTALSRRADDYAAVTVLGDACTTVSEMLHAIALNALSTRVRIQSVAEACAEWAEVEGAN